jgi:hypothetical protein
MQRDSDALGAQRVRAARNQSLSARRTTGSGARRPGELRGEQPGGDPGAAKRANLPADEIVAVADTVVVRPDPEPVAA